MTWRLKKQAGSTAAYKYRTAFVSSRPAGSDIPMLFHQPNLLLSGRGSVFSHRRIALSSVCHMMLGSNEVEMGQFQ